MIPNNPKKPCYIDALLGQIVSEDDQQIIIVPQHSITQITIGL